MSKRTELENLKNNVPDDPKKDDPKGKNPDSKGKEDDPKDPASNPENNSLPAKLEKKLKKMSQRMDLLEKENQELRKKNETLEGSLKARALSGMTQYEKIQQLTGKRKEVVGLKALFAVPMNGKYATANSKEELEPLANAVRGEITRLCFPVYKDGAVGDEPASLDDVRGWTMLPSDEK